MPDLSGSNVGVFSLASNFASKKQVFLAFWYRNSSQSISAPNPPFLTLNISVYLKMLDLLQNTVVGDRRTAVLGSTQLSRFVRLGHKLSDTNSSSRPPSYNLDTANPTL